MIVEKLKPRSHIISNEKGIFFDIVKRMTNSSIGRPKFKKFKISMVRTVCYNFK